MRRLNLWVGLGLLALMGLMVWTSFNTTRVECEVCITYDGRTKCGTAGAPTQEEAVRAASDVACSGLASGRAGNLACGRARPSSLSCSE
jgi:hypothetical protein